MIEITINIMELAVELATNTIFKEELLKNPNLTEDEVCKVLFTEDSGDTLVWTAEIQDKFNDLYDEYYTIIEKTKIK